MARKTNQQQEGADALEGWRRDNRPAFIGSIRNASPLEAKLADAGERSRAFLEQIIPAA
jgi:hypothetical protein